MRRKEWVVFGLMVMGLAGAGWAQPYGEKAGPREVGRVMAVWKDAGRDREVPVLICYPKDLGKGGEAAPVIVFSHGLGGTRMSYEAYGTHWASYGYVVVFPQHHGSDDGALADMQAVRDGTLKPADELKAFLDRTEDVHFVIDQVEAMNAGKVEGKDYEAFKGKLDVKRIGMAGHSFGAITTQAAVGEAYDLPVRGTTFTDKRVVAGVAMSPYPPMLRENLDGAFGGIKVPVLYMTGTKDTVAARAEDRRIPFDHSKTAGTVFVNFLGGDHMVFMPMLRPRDISGKASFQKVILQATTAYWDAYLKQDGKAKEWLGQELATEVGKLGKVEQK